MSNLSKLNDNRDLRPWPCVPRTLTAENGAKAALSGEFYETLEVDNPEWCECDDCDWCETQAYCPDDAKAKPTMTIQIPVSWTNIKKIWAKAVKHFDR